MKLWTVLAGLAVAGILASSAFAQDAPKKGKGKRGAFTVTFAELTKDGAKANQQNYVKVALAKITAVRTDMTDEQKTQATTRITSRWAAIVKGSGAAGDAASVELTEDQYNAGVKSLPARGKGKRPADKT